MSSSYDFKKTSQEVASILLDIKAIHFRPDRPYELTSGLMSPTYIDCRRLIGFALQRKRIMDLAHEYLKENLDMKNIDGIAGGETAGIPYAAFLAQSFNLPMQYIRKKPKGFGTKSRIEGHFEKNDQILLVEDLATDGGSKWSFVQALTEEQCHCRDIFVIFFYNIFPQAKIELEKRKLNLHYLTTWQDVLEVALEKAYFSQPICDEVKNFLNDPLNWSKKHKKLS